MTEEYQDYISSDEWKEKKTAQIVEYGLCCSKCGKELSRRDLDLHHKSYDKEFGSETEEDLMLVCKDCHKELHQDVSCFDNQLMKDCCPQCNQKLLNNKCERCKIEIIKKERLENAS